MQQTNRHGAALALTLACGATAVGCNSEHYIGDLDLPVTTPEDGPTAIDVADADFRVSPNLAPPDISMDAELWLSAFSRDRIAGLGDLDADGFNDYATLSGELEGAYTFVSIRYGGPRPTDFVAEFAFIYGASRVSWPTASPDLVGVAAAGDVDADGYADFLVTAGTTCDREPSPGPEGAYLVYGGPSRLPAAASLDDVGTFLPRPPVASLGDSCGTSRTAHTGVGDLDADGFDDFIISENRKDAGLAKAYLFYGGAERLVSGTSWLDADLRLLAEARVIVRPLGDIDADGFADVLFDEPNFASESISLIRGRAERFEGDQIIASVGMPFVDAWPAGDLDADGTQDVLLYDDAFNPHLFYGAPGRFDAGVDLATADATFLPYPGQSSASVIGVGDIDGDGDDELAARFFDQAVGFTLRGSDFWGIHTLAFISGSRTRLSGVVAPPAPSSPFARGPFGGEGMDTIVSIGDIDGDGTDELLSDTQSYSYDPIEGWEAGFEYLKQHIHFGVRGGDGAERPR
jgi:hypothetical protein